MTIARDHTGAVVGQLTTPLEFYADSPRYALTHDDIAHGYPKFLRLLTRDGRYVTVRRSSVRLEERR